MDALQRLAASNQDLARSAGRLAPQARGAADGSRGVPPIEERFRPPLRSSNAALIDLRHVHFNSVRDHQTGSAAQDAAAGLKTSVRRLTASNAVLTVAAVVAVVAMAWRAFPPHHSSSEPAVLRHLVEIR